GAGLAVQPDQVLGVIVAVGHDGRARLARRRDRRPGRAPFGDGCGVEAQSGDQFGQPLDEQVGPALQRCLVIGQQGPISRRTGQDIGRRGGVQDGKGLDGGAVEGGGIGAVLDDAGEQGVAEILDHGQAVRGVDGDDLGRRQAERFQVRGDGGEGLDAAGRQAGDGVPAVGVAVFRRPGRIAGQALGGRDLIHQHQAGARRRGQPFIAPRRGVAGQGRADGLGQAGGAQEVETEGFAVRHGVPSVSLPTPLRQIRSQDGLRRPRRWRSSGGRGRASGRDPRPAVRAIRSGRSPRPGPRRGRPRRPPRGGSGDRGRSGRRADRSRRTGPG
uniref:Oxidoreductase n=1 Tax=Parastrongyloides trichosuri TaxID=131310 RepID=A0A0N4ZW51_PARTI